MLEETTNDWHENGNHLERFEPPDLFYSRVRGDVDAPQLLASHAQLIGHARKRGRPLFWMVDVSQIGRVLPAASRIDTPELDLCGLVIVGASFQQRVLVTLGIKAHRILYRRLVSIPVEFFPTEATARAWIADERAKNASG